MKIEINKNNIESFSSFLTNQIMDNKEKLNGYNKNTINKIIECVYETKNDFTIEELKKKVIDTITAFKKKIKKLVDYLKTIKISETYLFYQTEYERAREIKLEDIDELNDKNIINFQIYLYNNNNIIIRTLEFVYCLYEADEKIFIINSNCFSEVPFRNEILYPKNSEETLFEKKDTIKLESLDYFQLLSSDNSITNTFITDMANIEYFSKKYSYETEQKLTSKNDSLIIDVNVKTTEEKVIIKAVLNKEKMRVDYSINVETNFIKTLDKDIVNMLEKELAK